MAKKIKTYIKLQVKAGQANPSPPIGPALGQQGINIMEFCKAFNAKTKLIEEGTPISVVITVYIDKSFTFITKTTPTSFLLKKAAKIKSGSASASKEVVGSITVQQLKDIATTKKPDLTAANVDAAIRTITGTARSMGLNVGDVK